MRNEEVRLRLLNAEKIKLFLEAVLSFVIMFSAIAVVSKLLYLDFTQVLVAACLWILIGERVLNAKR